MNADEFKRLAKDCIDYIADYAENIRDRQVLPQVELGYLHKLMPDEAPQKPDHWSQIIPDVERLLMPGITHVPSPMFNAYYPAGYSYPSIVGEILSAGIGCVVLNRETSPACTELEVIVLDWLAKMFGLPRHFLASDDGPGGGIIQQSASEGVLVALLAAKMRTVKRVKMENPDWDEDIIKTKLVAYSSVESNLCVEKAGKLGSMTLRLLPADQDGRLRGAELARAILRDKHRGLIPCYVVATLGTTGTCAFDCLQEIGQVCQPQRIWLHVDAAYAGAAFVCPEYRHLMEGVELADSFTMNPHKWLLANFDCSTLWVKDRKYILDAFSIERPYMKSVESDRENYAPDFRNWEIGLGRRFRSLKLWLTLRLYGVAALQDRVRHHVSLAQRFANHVRLDPRFEIYKRPQLGLVCFKLKGKEGSSRELVRRLAKDGRVFLVDSTSEDGECFIRYCVASWNPQQEDIDTAWNIIASLSTEL